MNKLGIFINFWENKWDTDHAKYIKKVANIGYDILEFQAQALLEMSDERIKYLKDLADENGIELTYSLGLDPRYDISSTDESVRLSGVEYLKRILCQMEKAGGKVISGVSYAGWGVPNCIIDDKRAYREASIKSMRELVKTAEDFGIDYCVEVVNRFEGILLNTAKEALDYVNEIGSNNLGVLLDTYHMNIEEANIGDAIRLVGDKLYGFHTGENNRTAPGRGHLDWDEIFGALSDIGYEKRIVCEPFVMMGGEVGKDIHVFRDLIDDKSEEALDREAKYILDFERAMILKHAK
jgi:D-psicose/D-tagatose/L-ribulose 3-epimerase